MDSEIPPKQKHPGSSLPKQGKRLHDRGLGTMLCLFLHRCEHHGPVFTFVNKVVGLQVKSLPVTRPPQAGDGGIELPAAERLHGGRCGQKVPLPPDEGSSIRAVTFPLQALWRHLEGQVMAGNVDVARVVSLVGIVFTSLPVPSRVRLVPIIGADRHGEEPQRAQSQEEPCAG